MRVGSIAVYSNEIEDNEKKTVKAIEKLLDNPGTPVNTAPIYKMPKTIAQVNAG